MSHDYNNEKYIGTAGKSAKWLANIPQKVCRFLVVSMKVQKVIESGWAPFETISKGGYIEGEP